MMVSKTTLIIKGNIFKHNHGGNDFFGGDFFFSDKYFIKGVFYYKLFS